MGQVPIAIPDVLGDSVPVGPLEGKSLTFWVWRWCDGDADVDGDMVLDDCPVAPGPTVGDCLLDVMGREREVDNAFLLSSFPCGFSYRREQREPRSSRLYP